MRLIDADVLPAKLYEKHVHNDDELEMLIYLDDAVEIIADAPTIDAIPVEWLEGVIDKMRRGVHYIPARWLDEVICLWQKENVAR